MIKRKICFIKIFLEASKNFATNNTNCHEYFGFIPALPTAGRRAFHSPAAGQAVAGK